MLVLLPLTATPNHAVNRRGASKNLASGPIDLALIELGLGCREEPPYRAVLPKDHADASRDLQPDPMIIGASLNQCHRPPVLREPRGERAAG